MENKTLKYILGKAVAGEPADICFYDDVDWWSVQDFLWEFDYLVDSVKPSKIRVHINSCGGNVVDGISVFSKIIDCNVPTDCIIDGLAASMASIIWAAGDEVYMKDYALLMIHNPFVDNGETKEYSQVTEAFKKQLKTIYTKRFGLDAETVENIMNGEPGNDGTFFTAEEAVENGFIEQSHIIETPQAKRGQIEAALKGVSDMAKIKAVMAMAISAPAPAVKGETKIAKLQISNNDKMEKNEITVVAALLGLTGDKATAENVSATITELKGKADKYDEAQAELAQVKSSLSDLQTKLAASEASVSNLTENLNTAKASLEQYQEKEKAEKEAKISALVDDAIKACKINKEDRESWISMAQSNFELAEKTLASIPAREDLGKAIAKDANDSAKDGMKSEEEKVQDKVNEVVGNGFAFRTME